MDASFSGLTGRLHYTLITLAATGFAWFMFSWNLA
jgi:hypothetical protein